MAMNQAKWKDVPLKELIKLAIEFIAFDEEDFTDMSELE